MALVESSWAFIAHPLVILLIPVILRLALPLLSHPFTSLSVPAHPVQYPDRRLSISMGHLHVHSISAGHLFFFRHKTKPGPANHARHRNIIVYALCPRI